MLREMRYNQSHPFRKAWILYLAGLAVLSLAMRDRTEMVRRYNEAREQVSAAVVEFVQAMPVVRTFDTGQSTFGRYQRALDSYLGVLVRWYAGAGCTVSEITTQFVGGSVAAGDRHPPRPRGTRSRPRGRVRVRQAHRGRPTVRAARVRTRVQPPSWCRAYSRP